MQFRKTPLLLPACCLFLGGLGASYSFVDVDFWSIVLVCFLLFLIGIAICFPQMNAIRSVRLLVVGSIYLVLGSVLFQLNDYRNNEKTFQSRSKQAVDILVHVDEIKREDGNEQQVLVKINYQCFHDSLIEKSGKCLVTVTSKRVKLDDELLIHGTLSRIENLGNPGEFNAVYYYGSKGIIGRMIVDENQVLVLGNSATINGWFGNWRMQLGKQMEKQLDGVFLGVAKALLLGDKANLDQDTMRVFSNTGSMHVLAVSGLHVGLLLIMFQKVLLLFARWISKRNALFLSLVLVWVYGLLSGASPSVMRAVVMFTIISGAPLLYRKTDALNALFLSAIGLFVYDPWVMFDIGFQLSYAAMIGIFIFYHPIQEALVFRNKWLQQAWEGTAVGLAATICTTPITLFWFYQFPNYFLVANFGVMVFGFLVLLAGMVFLVLNFVPFVNTLVAFVFSLTIIGLVEWVSWIDRLPGAVSGGFHLSNFQLICSCLLLVAWIIVLHRKKHLPLIGFITIVLVTWVSVLRLNELNSSEFIVLKSNRFIAIVKTPNGSIGFYDPKKGLAVIVPRELAAFENYSGVRMTAIALEHDSLNAQFKGNRISITRSKNGWEFKLNNQSYWYQSYGVPRYRNKPQWMALAVQKHLDPSAHFPIFRKTLSQHE